MIKLHSGFLLSIFFFLAISCSKYDISDQQKEKFVKYYPNEFDENYGINVIQNSEGKYILMGHSLINGVQGNHFDIMMVFTDAFGNQFDVSPVFFGSDGDDLARSMVMAEDGFIIVGTSENNGLKSAYVLKVSTTGQLIWEKHYAEYAEQGLNKIIDSGDGGYVATGYHKDLSGSDYLYLLKINNLGDSLWTRSLGTQEFNDEGFSLVKIQNRFVMVGTSTPAGNMSSYSNLLIYNTDLNGNNPTFTRIAGDYDLEGKDIVVDKEGNIVLLGNQYVPYSSERQIFLGKITLGGTSNDLINIEESKYLETVESISGEQIIPNQSGSWAITGWRSRQNDIDIMFSIVDQNFRLVALNFFGATGYQATFGLVQCNDQGYVLTGSAEQAGSKFCTLLKVSALGEF